MTTESVSTRNLKQAIERYKKDHRREDGSINPDAWCAACMEAKSFHEAVGIATSARDRLNRKHPHQKRISDKLPEEFAQSLQKESQALARAADFTKLMSLVSAAALAGIGDLAVYDTALRLGFRRNIRPTLVYLHRGTLSGAQLLGVTAKESIAKDCLPDPLKNSDLDPGELEDFLCIFHKTAGSTGSESCGSGEGSRRRGACTEGHTGTLRPKVCGPKVCEPKGCGR
ncbi:MAG: hypothetical protein LBR99_02400 [Treponema sp.]|nr:hypothetical protein [Treponema sp.]